MKIAHQNISVITVFSLIDIFLTFYEFDTFVGIIDDSGVSIVSFFDGDARICSGLLKYEKVSEAKAKACV
jgi:hypothetical protein